MSIWRYVPEFSLLPEPTPPPRGNSIQRAQSIPWKRADSFTSDYPPFAFPIRRKTV